MNSHFAALRSVFVQEGQDVSGLYLGFNKSLLEMIMGMGVPHGAAQFLINSGWFILTLLLAYVSYFIARNALKKVSGKIGNKTYIALNESGIFRKLCYFFPWFIIRVAYKYIWDEFPGFLIFMGKLMPVLFVIIVVMVINSALKAGETLYHRSVKVRATPIKGFIQFVQMGLWFFTVIVCLSIILSQSPMVFIGGLGAASAVLMLIFKDSILGLVAGFQIMANNMVRIGDWIEMPKYNADGDVIDITLTTVKVQNWDKTISTIPAYYLITDAVKNWRGMEESGGRRIARSVYIDMHSVRFCTAEDLEQFRKIKYLTKYIDETEKEIQKYNAEHGIDNSVIVNGRRQTNLGIFRAYVGNYLRNHPHIKQDMTLLVRQMTLTEKGLPIQIYCFTNTTAWGEYENIQSDIFDHTLAVLPYFGLSVFQNIGGRDFYKRLDEVPVSGLK